MTNQKLSRSKKRSSAAIAEEHGPSREEEIKRYDRYFERNAQGVASGPIPIPIGV